MRILPVLIGVAALVAIVKCNSPSEDDSSTESSSADSSYTDEIEADEDGLYESVRSPMDKAQNVENVLQDAADARAAEIEEASDDN